MRDVLLHSNAGVVFLETLDEGWDGVEGGAAEGRRRFDGCLRGHVVFGPLEVAAWFYCSVLETRMWETSDNKHSAFVSCSKIWGQEAICFVLGKKGQRACMYGDWIL